MTFPTSVIRKLARSEEMFAQTKTFVGTTVLLDGPVDSAAMSAAFDALLEAHPLLAGHLEKGPDGLHQIVVDEFLHPGIWVVDADHAPPTGAAGVRLDQSVSLGNLRLTLADGRAEVSLYIHHSLADARHAFRLLEELFSFYTDVVCTGDIGPVSAEPGPQPLEVVLDDRGIKKQQRSGLERFTAAMFAYELSPSARKDAGGNPSLPLQVPVARCLLTEQETTGLSTFCRDHRLSVHALVSAAILLAEWQIRNTPNIPIPYLYPVDLRLLVSPPVEATASTNPLGVATYLAKIGPSTDIVDLASDIVETFRADLADGVTQQSLLHFNLQYAGTPPGLPDIVMASDGGTVPGLRTPPDVMVAGVQSELFNATSAGVDMYAFLVFSGQLHIEHHAHAPAPDRTIEAIHALLCAIPSDDDWMSE